MNFGGQVVTFVSVKPTGEPDELGTHAMSQTNVDVYGCHHRPVTSTDTGTLTREFPEIGISVATVWWKTTAPPVAAALNAQPSDVIKVDGKTFQILGTVQAKADLSGRVDHVTIVSERQEIGH